jgi:hypothetical protein
MRPSQPFDAEGPTRSVNPSGPCPRKIAVGVAFAATVACSLLPGPAQAATSATIVPSFSPNRSGARAALTFTIRYAGGELGIPSPLRHAVLRFPAGLRLHIPHLRSCSTERLRDRGASGCPAQSRIGGGAALVESPPDSQPIVENVTLHAFLGPPQNLRPTFEIVAEGLAPVAVSVVLEGTMRLDRAPYGEQLVMSIPPIPTIPSEPDASIVMFSLTVGTSRRRHMRDANAVVVPPRCPHRGFPFAAEFSYADGSSASATATTPCPR